MMFVLQYRIDNTHSTLAGNKPGQDIGKSPARKGVLKNISPALGPSSLAHKTRDGGGTPTKGAHDSRFDTSPATPPKPSTPKSGQHTGVAGTPEQSPKHADTQSPKDARPHTPQAQPISPKHSTSPAAEAEATPVLEPEASDEVVVEAEADLDDSPDGVSPGRAYA